jgi:Domain of unknown function (DUF4386)
MPGWLGDAVLYPKVVISGNAAQSVQNIVLHGGTFAAAILCYLLNFAGDIVIAWALYALLAPVNQSLSLLAAWFRVIYDAMRLMGLLNLVAAYRMVHTPSYTAAFGEAGLRAQVDLLLHSFRYDWLFAEPLFGTSLCLAGFLFYRSGYTGVMSKIVGLACIVSGIGWSVWGLAPYLLPGVDVDWVFFTFFGEVLLIVWLLVAGWKIRSAE